MDLGEINRIQVCPVFGKFEHGNGTWGGKSEKFTDLCFFFVRKGPVELQQT
jgi:hypothetical protein